MSTIEIRLKENNIETNELYRKIELYENQIKALGSKNVELINKNKNLQILSDENKNEIINLKNFNIKGIE